MAFGSLPEPKDEVSKLKNLCAVYIFFRCYEGFKGKTLVYVGKSQNFIERLATHYGDFLSSKYGTVYREDGSTFRKGGLPLYFQSLQGNLDETLLYAKEDARGTKFVYARTDNLEGLEATIISKVED